MPGINYRYLMLIYVQVLVRRRRRIAQIDSPKQRRLPKILVRPSLQKREELEAFHTLFKEYRDNDREYIFRFCRMAPESFDYLAYMIESKNKKKISSFRKPISPEERLAVTLRYLASGETQQAIQQTLMLIQGKGNSIEFYVKIRPRAHNCVTRLTPRV